MEAPVHACLIATNIEAATGLRLVGIDAPADLLARLEVPGQFVLAGPPNGSHARFVVCSPIDDRSHWEVLVHAGGESADALAELSPGTSVEVSAPLGPGFPMDRVHAHEGDLVLVCAGSAIGALRPVLHALVARRKRLERVRLYLGVRTRAHAAFHSEIEKWREVGLTARLCVSREDTAPDVAHGHVQRVLKQEGTSLEDPLVLAAGPAGLVRALEAGIRSIGLPAGAVLTNLG